MSDERNGSQEVCQDSQAMTEEQGRTRRDFIQTSLLAASGLALAAAIPSGVEAQEGGCPGAGETLRDIVALKTPDNGTTLQAVLTVTNEKKSFWALQDGKPVCYTGQMRYFTGNTPGKPQVWPTAPLKGIPNPGPTLRAKVGDKVEVTLLNHVDVHADFPVSLDRGEAGMGCDVARVAGPNGPTERYPGTNTFPNCFHGSSTGNLHYHGLHVSPANVGDNVLIELRPSPLKNGKYEVDEAFVRPYFSQVFKDYVPPPGDHHHPAHPVKWEDLPEGWRKEQDRLLHQDDVSAPWNGGTGRPPDQQLLRANQEQIKDCKWPEYYIGGYPNCFVIPKWNGQKDDAGHPTSMGQAPGTHWYHSHKHGSVNLNVANGMSGALIVEGDYDDKLRPFIAHEHVLVIQDYTAMLSSLRPPTPKTSDAVFVNGQFRPVIEMKPGEMHLWRIVNATQGSSLPLDAPKGGLKWVITARDGVQLHQDRYNPDNSTSAVSLLAAGNRCDLLVQAPASVSGDNPFTVTSGGTILFQVRVTKDSPVTLTFPTRAQFPVRPEFLKDIDADEVKVWRKLRFATASNGQLIDGAKFNGKVSQSMVQGAVEEWIIYNDGGAAHPFHIHVNPFQVTEIFDPKVSDQPIVEKGPLVWWDTFEIPSPANGKSGYIKVRHRFLDYTGMYVLHCHILFHEDHGMMQLVQVVPNATAMKHE